MFRIWRTKSRRPLPRCRTRRLLLLTYTWAVVSVNRSESKAVAALRFPSRAIPAEATRRLARMVEVCRRIGGKKYQSFLLLPSQWEMTNQDKNGGISVLIFAWTADLSVWVCFLKVSGWGQEIQKIGRFLIRIGFWTETVSIPGQWEYFLTAG